MIFLTVGTQLPFDRLVNAMDIWAESNPEHQIFGQIGSLARDNYRPKHFKWVEHLQPDVFEQHFNQADCIAAHAGTGTIIGALTKGKPLVVMPRDADLGEHRNNHQMATVRKFSERPGLHIAQQSNDLPACLKQALAADVNQMAHASAHAEDSLLNALRDAILRQV